MLSRLADSLQYVPYLMGSGSGRRFDVMGGPDGGSRVDVMGGPDRGLRVEVMGGPDRGPRVSVMGGPDRGLRVEVMGGPDPARFPGAAAAGGPRSLDFRFSASQRGRGQVPTLATAESRGSMTPTVWREHQLAGEAKE